MSEVVSNELIDEVIPEAGTEGQIAEAIEEIESLSEREIELLPVNEYGDKYVVVQVNGEEVRVPLKEALAGYQRQADYTRKTQELSDMKRQVHFGSALQEALQNNPGKTLELLSEHYGIKNEGIVDDDYYVDPVEKQYRNLEQRIQAFEQDKAMSELERTVESLQKRYGDDFDANEIVAKAIATGTTDLESVYKQVAFDRVYESSKEARQFKEKLTSEQKVMTAAKRQVGVVSGGTNSTSASVTTKPITSLRDAYEAAKRQHA